MLFRSHPVSLSLSLSLSPSPCLSLPVSFSLALSLSLHYTQLKEQVHSHRCTWYTYTRYTPIYTCISASTNTHSNVCIPLPAHIHKYTHILLLAYTDQHVYVCLLAHKYTDIQTHSHTYLGFCLYLFVT